MTAEAKETAAAAAAQARGQAELPTGRGMPRRCTARSRVRRLRSPMRAGALPRARWRGRRRRWRGSHRRCRRSRAAHPTSPTRATTASRNRDQGSGRERHSAAGLLVGGSLAGRARGTEADEEAPPHALLIRLRPDTRDAPVDQPGASRYSGGCSQSAICSVSRGEATPVDGRASGAPLSTAWARPSTWPGRRRVSPGPSLGARRHVERRDAGTPGRPATRPRRPRARSTPHSQPRTPAAPHPGVAAAARPATLGLSCTQRAPARRVGRRSWSPVGRTT
jgi:hypothetical protein